MILLNSKQPQAGAKHQLGKSHAVLNWFGGIARGLALFLAIYALISLVAYFLGSHYNRNSWWIDLSSLPSLIAAMAQLILTLALFVFALKAPSQLWIRLIEFATFLAFAIFAIGNALDVYSEAANGSIKLHFPAPFSLFIALGFIYLAIFSITTSIWQKASLRKPVFRIIVTVLVMLVLFPLAQILCFGTTTYNGKVDATVVLGAQVLPSGQPSDVLQERLDTAISMYQRGDTKLLIMSGGIDIGKTDEAAAMSEYAQSRGVPAKDIIVDSAGSNTQATAINTVALMKEYNIDKIAAVSDFFHLARVKMLFLDAGSDVITVPSAADKPPTVWSVLREVPGWWYYWFVTIV